VRYPSLSGQAGRHPSFPADGKIASATLPQLILPDQPSRAFLHFQNTSSAIMWFGFGSARATCTISGGAVATFTITNPGFNFTRPPSVTFLGGGQGTGNGVIPTNTSYVGAAGPQFPAPASVAQAHAVLTGGAVTSIVLDFGGSGYVQPPLVFLQNDPLDPLGAFDPSYNSGSGFQLYPGNSIYEAGNMVETGPLAVFCATLNSTFACRYMP
jgi:hypothetical protein